MYHLRPDEDEWNRSVEFVPATPLEYLNRWQMCNTLFQDEVELHRVLQWKDGSVSFVISQPQYNGELPSAQEIESYFEKAGWQRIIAEEGRSVFYNYAFSALALDIEPRNCYIAETGEILPFDVILAHPNREVENFLGLYP